MKTIAALTAFLRNLRTNDDPDMVSLCGGKYHIGTKNHKKFLKLYCDALPDFREGAAPSLS